MLNHIMELAEYEVPTNLKSLKNSFDDLITYSTLYHDSIFCEELDLNVGWIKGRIKDSRIRIVFSHIPEAGSREDVENNYTVVIVKIVDMISKKDLYIANSN